MDHYGCDNYVMDVTIHLTDYGTLCNKNFFVAAYWPKFKSKYWLGPSFKVSL